VQLVSKFSNLCGPDPPTSQTDRRTTSINQSIMALLKYDKTPIMTKYVGNLNTEPRAMH